MELCCEIRHLLLDLLVLTGLLLQLLLHLVQCLHHFFLLLGLGIALPLLLLQLLLKLGVLFSHFFRLLFPLFDFIFID